LACCIVDVDRVCFIIQRGAISNDMADLCYQEVKIKVKILELAGNLKTFETLFTL
jgi:hypothetical protein